MGRFTVVYDACVLYPAPLRDLLMPEDLFRACWSDAIHDEWIRSVLARRPDLTRDQLERTRDLMNSSVLDSVVTDYEHFIPLIELPDENDLHDFLVQQFHLSEAKLVGSARKVRNRLKNPPLSAAEYLDILEKQRLPKTVALLRSFRLLI